MRGLTNPELFRIVQYSDQFTDQETAVGRSKYIRDCFCKPATGGGALLNPGDIFAVLFRDPLRSNITYDPNVEAVTASYNLYFVPDNGASLAPQDPTLMIDLVLNLDDQILPLAFAQATTAYQPHGVNLYCGFDPKGDQSAFIWIDEGTVVTYQFVDGTAFDIALDQWTPDGIKEEAFLISLTTTFHEKEQPPVQMLTQRANPHSSQHKKTDNNTVQRKKKTTHSFKKTSLLPCAGHWPLPTATPGGGNTTVTSSGYYRFRTISDVTFDDTPILGLSGIMAGGGPHMCHRPLKDLEANISSAKAVRILGLSVLLKNTSSDLIACGNLAMVQSQEGVDWTSYLTTIKAADDPHAFTPVLKTGGYGWMRPSCEEDYDKIENINVTPTGLVSKSFFPLRGGPPFIVLQASTNPDSSGDFPFTGRLTFCYGIEFGSTNSWFSTEVPNTMIDAYREALAHLRDVDQFSENPNHILSILKGIGNVTSKMVQGVNKYLPIATEFGNLLSRIA